MNGTDVQVAAPAGEEQVSELQESFRVFTKVTRDLERVYRRLQHRTAAIESRLREANGRLTARVEELGRLNDELGGILLAIPCGVVVCDASGGVSRVNPAAETILGRPATELVGRSARTLRGPGGRPVLIVGSDDFEVGAMRERRVTCLDGATRHVSGSVAPLPDGGFLEILTDQTEVAHLRSQVNRLDTLAALGEMAAGVAHEIRNPMNGVQGFAGLLEKALRSGDPPDRSQLMRYVGRIRRGVGEVEGIISNLLLWARPERTQVRPFDLVDLLSEVLDDVRAALRGPVTRDFGLAAADGPVEVEGDRLKLKLVFSNLVRNAAEAGGADGRVRLTAGADGGRAAVSVDDDGPGVSPAVRARLFRPFTTTKPAGTGLGLAIARKLVDLHGGEIRLSDGPLGGARFTVWLPLRGDGGKA